MFIYVTPCQIIVIIDINNLSLHTLNVDLCMYVKFRLRQFLLIHFVCIINLQCVVLPMLLCVVNCANLPYHLYKTVEKNKQILFVFFNCFMMMFQKSYKVDHNRMLLRVLFQILLQFFESNGRDKFAKLSANAKGFLTRCLMKTAKVQGLIQTIKVRFSHVH